MLILNAIERKTSRTSGKIYFRLYCTDDYDNKQWLCGSPQKLVDCSENVLTKALGGEITLNGANAAVGKEVFAMYNERGYTTFVRFNDPEERKAKASASASVADLYGSSSSATDTPASDDNDYVF